MSFETVELAQGEMTCKRCATCMHWTLREHWMNDQQAASRSELYREDARHWRMCWMMESKDGDPYEESTKAYARDSSWYSSDVWTHEDFGCIMWEARSGLRISDLTDDEELPVGPKL